MSTTAPTIHVARLTYTGPDSPKGKCYVAAWDESGNGVVAWGGGDTPGQFKNEVAAKVERKIAEKLAKGYVVDRLWTVDGTLDGDAFDRYEHATGQARTFDSIDEAVELAALAPTHPVARPVAAVQLVPQLATDSDPRTASRFIGSDDYVAERKYDGERVLAIVEAGQVTVLNRSGKARGKRFAPQATVATCPADVVLDGEIVGDTFHVFDLIRHECVDADSDYEERRYHLDGLFSQWQPGPAVRLAPVARTAAEKQALHDQVKAEGGEGLVFKRTDAPYRAGRQTGWLKCKFVTDVDVIVVAIGENDHNSATVALIDPDLTGTAAVVTVGKASLNGKEHLGVQVGSVVTVSYLSCDPEKRRLVQCRIVGGPRTDKPMSECTVDQLRFTTKEVLGA